jgi:hypothetical protein
LASTLTPVHPRSQSRAVLEWAKGWWGADVDVETVLLLVEIAMDDHVFAPLAETNLDLSVRAKQVKQTKDAHGRSQFLPR